MAAPTGGDEFVSIGDQITFDSDGGGLLSVDVCGKPFWETPHPGVCLYSVATNSTPSVLL